MHPRHQLWQHLLVGTLLASTTAVARAEPSLEPYRVWPRAADVVVFAGPGEDYYPTQRLTADTPCEVYQELPDGWLAIRPPEQSYSLVLRSAIEPFGDGTARITRDRTASRVGSHVTGDTTAVHVRLEEGERIELLSDASAEQGAWVKIAPPAGEFRWVRAHDVSRDPLAQAAEVVRTSATADSPQPGASETQQQQTDPDPAGGASLPPTPEPTTNLGASFEQQLIGIELQLSRRVAGPANLWVFDDLERSAAALLSTASSTAEQQAVRELAARLERFSALRQRHRTQQIAAPDGGQTATAEVTPIGTQTPEGQFDAVGILRPVVSSRGNAPPYALVDDAGNVVTFVTPAPTLNLQQHLGQRVGVNGTRGFLPAYRSRNIQTARVAPLDATRTRY